MDRAISIIIPCYNCEDYIEKTLQSIIDQTFKNFEIIIVNDESKDKSVEVSENILTKNNISFKIVNQKNSGVSRARNNGIDHSTGKYVFMIDSDDFIEPTFIEKMHNKLERYNLDMAFSGHDRVDTNDKVSFIYTDRYEYIQEVLSGEEVVKNVIKNKMLLWTGCIVYKRDLLNNNNIRYVENCSNGEDQEFWTKALINSQKVASVNEILSHYLQREKSITHSPSLRRFTALGACNRTKKYLKEKNMDAEILELFDTYKYHKEFIYNFTSIATESADIAHLDKIIKSKSIRKKLKDFKMQSKSKSDLKNYLAIKAYLINPYMYAKLLNKCLK